MASGVKGFGRQIGHTDKTCSPVSQVRLQRVCCHCWVTLFGSVDHGVAASSRVIENPEGSMLSARGLLGVSSFPAGISSWSEERRGVPSPLWRGHFLEGNMSSQGSPDLEESLKDINCLWTWLSPLQGDSCHPHHKKAGGPGDLACSSSPLTLPANSPLSAGCPRPPRPPSRPATSLTFTIFPVICKISFLQTFDHGARSPTPTTPPSSHFLSLLTSSQKPSLVSLPSLLPLESLLLSDLHSVDQLLPAFPLALGPYHHCCLAFSHLATRSTEEPQ